MKQHFLKLFGYDYYANEIILKAVQEAGNPNQAVKLMAHMLSAQQIWLARCRQGPNAPGNPLWPEDWTIEQLLAINQQNNEDWLAFLEGKTEAYFDAVFSYKTSIGLTFTNGMVDILTHLINHGTHHRAQAGQVLKNAGFNKLPNTDYIMYLRANK
jgi:uncharacterized damage-inducible protein DinB